MIIRKATLKDLEEIKDLNQELFYHDYIFDKTLDVNWPERNEEYYKNRIKGKNAIALVADINNKIVVYLFGVVIKAEDYRTIKHIAELENMLVIEKYRGKGIGRELIQKLVQWAKEKRIKRIKVVASAQNTRAIEVYKKLGFKEQNLALEADI